MNNPDIRAVIFDLDGTLAETVDDISTAINEMRTALGFDTITRDKVLLEVNYDTYTFIKHCLPEGVEDDETIAKATDLYKKAYARCYAEKTYPYPGLVDMVKRMHAAGKPMAVISNKLDEFTKVIAAKLYGDYFKLVLGSGTEYPHKPDPFTAKMFAEQVGVPVENVGFVGDSETDMKTATNAGMVRVAVAWGYRSEEHLLKHGAQYVAHTGEELDKILNG